MITVAIVHTHTNQWEHVLIQRYRHATVKSLNNGHIGTLYVIL